MGRLAVYKFAYFLSILFTIFILGLSIFAYFSGKINPVENMFAAYVALSKPILVVVNTILFIYWLIRLRYWLWIPLTGLIVNYEYITSMYQIYNPTKYANENRLKVVTYNVHSFGNEITGFSAKEFAEMMNKEENIPLLVYPRRIESGHLQPLPHQTVTNNRISEYQQRSHLGRPGCKRYDDTHHQRAHADYQL